MILSQPALPLYTIAMFYKNTGWGVPGPTINAGQGNYWKLLGWGLTGSLEEEGSEQGDFAYLLVVLSSCELTGVNWVVVLVVWGIL